MRKDHALRDLHTLYGSLQSTICDLSHSAETKRQLNATRRALTAKTRKLKVLTAEAEAREKEAKRKDLNLETLKREVVEKKQTILKEKRDKQKLKLHLDVIKTQLHDDERPVTCPPIGQNYYRTAGAGFRIPNIYALLE